MLVGSDKTTLDRGHVAKKGRCQARRRRQGGNTMLEFALAMLILLPIFMGVVWGGVTIGRGIQVSSVARDVAQMYARSVDFGSNNCTSAYNPPSTAGFCNQDIVVRLSKGLYLERVNSPRGLGGGQSVFILSTIQHVYQSDCDLLPVGETCNNLGQDVFINRIVIGNAALRSSNFGTPGGVAPDGKVDNPFSSAAAVAHNFSPLLALGEGDIAYVVEGYVDSSDISMTSGAGGIYTVSIF